MGCYDGSIYSGSLVDGDIVPEYRIFDDGARWDNAVSPKDTVGDDCSLADSGPRSDHSVLDLRRRKVNTPLLIDGSSFGERLTILEIHRRVKRGSDSRGYFIANINPSQQVQYLILQYASKFVTFPVYPDFAM